MYCLKTIVAVRRSFPPLVTAAVARRRRRTFVVGAGRPRDPTLVVGPPTDRVFGHGTVVRRRRPAVSRPRLDVQRATSAAHPVAALPSATVPPAVRTGLRRRRRFSDARTRRVHRRVVGATFLDRPFRNRLPSRARTRRRGTVGRRYRRPTRRRRLRSVVLGAVASARS